MKTSATRTGDTHAENGKKLWAIDSLGPFLPRSAARAGWQAIANHQHI
jgi:hypothetical protein